MHLHIVAFNVPHPANYGGVIDVFYKLKALVDRGARVDLHCFQYGRPKSEELERLCANVHYYPKRPTFRSLPIRQPYIVGSRRSPDLIRRLAADSCPILFEGLHTCGDLAHPALRGKRKLVRAHNIEWSYYQQLAKSQSRPFMGMLMRREARLLRTCEMVLHEADGILTISPNDHQYYKRHFEHACYLPAFHPHSEITGTAGRGDYCVYHGNLGVADNHRAAMFLVKEVFAHLEIPFVIAGMEPLRELIDEVARHESIQLRANLSDEEMDRLAREAHIHVMPTFQVSGLKLKLLNALFSGRHCIVSPEMVEDTDLDGACDVVDDAAGFRDAIARRFDEPFTDEQIGRRRELLSPTYDNALNAGRLMSWLFDDAKIGSVSCA